MRGLGMHWRHALLSCLHKAAGTCACTLFIVHCMSECMHIHVQENRELKKEEAKTAKGIKSSAKGKHVTKKPAGKMQAAPVLRKPSGKVVPRMLCIVVMHACMIGTCINFRGCFFCMCSLPKLSHVDHHMSKRKREAQSWQSSCCLTCSLLFFCSGCCCCIFVFFVVASCCWCFVLLLLLSFVVFVVICCFSVLVVVVVVVSLCGGCCFLLLVFCFVFVVVHCFCCCSNFVAYASPDLRISVHAMIDQSSAQMPIQRS